MDVHHTIVVANGVRGGSRGGSVELLEPHFWQELFHFGESFR